MSDSPGATIEPQVTIDAHPGSTNGSSPQQTDGGQSPPPLDPAYVSRASAFNLSEEDLRTVPRDVVERMMAGSDRQMIAAHRNEERQWEPPPPSNGNSASRPPTGDFSFDQFALQFGDIEDDSAASPVIKNMTALHKHVSSQLEKLHKHYQSKFEDAENFRIGVLKQQDYAILDRFIESQGPEWSDVFGKGSTLEIDPRSQEFLNREEVRTAAIAMMQRSAANGRRLSAAEALPRARNAMFMEKAFAIERAKADRKRSQLESGADERPRQPGGTAVPLTIKDKARLMREAAMRA